MCHEKSPNQESSDFQIMLIGWFRGTEVECQSLASELSILHLTGSQRVTTYMGKPSVTGQSTRPTQPFILPRSINK